MTPVEVGASYDQIAARWRAPTFDNDNGIAAHKRALQFVSGKHALDVGCGSNGRLFTLMEQNGLTAQGLDVSPEMVALARSAFPHIEIHQADICTWQPTQSFDFISAWDSIWHVPLAEHAAVLTKLMQALTPGGVLIFTMGGLAHADEVFNHEMGVPMYHSTLGIPATLALIDNCGCVCRHLEFDQHPEPHVYVIAQKSP